VQQLHRRSGIGRYGSMIQGVRWLLGQPRDALDHGTTQPNSANSEPQRPRFGADPLRSPPADEPPHPGAPTRPALTRATGTRRRSNGTDVHAHHPRVRRCPLCDLVTPTLWPPGGYLTSALAKAGVRPCVVRPARVSMVLRRGLLEEHDPPDRPRRLHVDP